MTPLNHETLLADLTSAQREAVQHLEGPLLILAGPGSGKTRVVTHRIALLLAEGTPASQMIALTFTNKAADEMSARVQQLVPGKRVWISTFHRFGARLLREYGNLLGMEPNFTIYDARDSLQVIQRTMEEGGTKILHYTPDRIAAAISRAKNNLISAEQYQPQRGSPLSHILAEVYPAYQQRLRNANAVDFDDLLLHVARLLYHNPEIRAQLDDQYRFVLVDEYQDTNRAQYVILRALSMDYPNLAVTGDPDQSIYGWRGANLNNILEFEVDYPNVRVVRLEQNYRSTQRILHVADHLISHNRQRKHKALFTKNAAGPPVRLVRYANEMEEAAGIAKQILSAIEAGRHPNDFAVFYRVNALSRALEWAFHNAGIPFQLIRAQEFFQRKEIKDILGYCQLINNPRDDVAFLRIVNTPARGIGKKSIQRLSDYASTYGLTLLEAAREIDEIASMKKPAIGKFRQFIALIDSLNQFAHTSVEQIIRQVLDATGYRKSLEGSDNEEDINRLANIEELLTDSRQFDERGEGAGGLEAYLERLWLVSDIDDWDADAGKVSLMTLHAAKGLEFPVVFITALEQGILPHERSSQDPDQIEEERRLAFVGITRAEQELHLSYVQRRDFRGHRRTTVPSQFLMEMPRDALVVEWEEDSYVEGADTHFDRANRIHELQDSSIQIDSRHQDPSRREIRNSRQENQPAVDLNKVVTTGAALVGNRQLPTACGEGFPANPDAFTHGMTVIHPEYGPGKIIDLAGTGKNCCATVRFATAGERHFMVAHSPLRPVVNHQS
ncbi:MAG: UvrD-helicase domain-containing protein [Pirellulales bacterium]|nr:UvrD-helicase domain-containing protein [Pirellulales bacterium]